MFSTEPRWDIDLKLSTEEPHKYSVNDYVNLLFRRLKKAHTLAREHLKTTARKMSDWYDRKVLTQSFDVGDKVYILNLRQYAGRCHKWIRRYSDVATIVKNINSVTYMVHCDKWKRGTNRIVHVDKIKLSNKVLENPLEGSDTEQSVTSIVV